MEEEIINRNTCRDKQTMRFWDQEYQRKIQQLTEFFDHLPSK